MSMWSAFDDRIVAAEFSLIRDLGLDLVRVFLFWEDFQPTPDTVSAEAVRNLRRVCDIAAERHLKLDVTFFTGHMSGPNWAPPWLLQGPPAAGARQVVSGGRTVASGYLNPYVDPLARAAERLLLTRVVRELAGHPAIACWNLGNEPDLFARPPSAEAGSAWVGEMTALIRELDPDHPITCGLHVPSLSEHNGLRVDQVFSHTDFAVMHAYPMYADWAREPLDPDVVPFSCALTTALCGKPVLMEEFGGCTAPPGEPSQILRWQVDGAERSQFMASETELADYIEQVLERLLDVGATGAVLWCFADYVEALWDRPPCDRQPHERFFGIVRPDGSLKPHAEVLRRFAARAPEVRPAVRRVELAMTPDEFYLAPLDNLKASFARFVDRG